MPLNWHEFREQLTAINRANGIARKNRNAEIRAYVEAGEPIPERLLPTEEVLIRRAKRRSYDAHHRAKRDAKLRRRD